MNINDMIERPRRVGNVWLWPDGTKLPVVSGGTDTPPGTPPANPPATPPPGTPPPSGGGSGPTAESLDKLNEWMRGIAAREKAEGRASVEKQIAETLGMTLEEAKKLVDAKVEADRAQMTEAERKFDDAKKLREDGRNDKREAEKLIMDMLKQDALMDLGMTRVQAKGAVDLLQADVANSPEMTMANIAAGAQQVKVAYPQLFTPTRSGPPDSTTRGAPPANNGGGNDARDRATARLRERRGGTLRSDAQHEQRRPEMDYTRRST